MVESSFVRGVGCRRARRTTVSPTLWTPFPFRPVHAWLVWCWPACVWSVYGQVAAAAAVLLVRSRLGRLMVGLVCLGSIAVLPVVVPPHVVYAAGMSVLVLVSGVVVCPSVVLCSLLPLVGRVCSGSVVVFCCVRGYDRRWVWRTTVLPTRWAPFPFRPVHAWLARGGPWTAPLGAPADLKTPPLSPRSGLWLREGHVGRGLPSCSVVRVAPARRCGFAGAGPAAVALTASPFLLRVGAPPRPWWGGGPRLWLPS